jgi:NitT/TauT family transport system substrate-binding protein
MIFGRLFAHARCHRGLPVVVALVAMTVAACSNASAGQSSTKSVTLRLGYFPNVTHATAIVGLQEGIFARALGSGVRLQSTSFNAGPAAVEALFSGAIDATYIGPGPTVNAFTRSGGKAIKVISGATSGGAALVVKPEITSAADLKGKKVASPQVGNTQDIALRYWLKQHGLATTKEGGGDVSIVPQDNSQTVDSFAQGLIAGAWVPEPYASKLVAAGGKVLVDERELWPAGQFVTTNLVVRTEFLNAHPDAVKRLIEGQVQATSFIADHPDKAQQDVSDGIGKLTGKPLSLSTVKAAWANLTFTSDPLPTTLFAGAQHAVEVGLLEKPDLTGLYDLGSLNAVLKEHGLAQVSQP